MENVGKMKYPSTISSLKFTVDKNRQGRNNLVAISLVKFLIYNDVGNTQNAPEISDCVFRNIDTILGAPPIFDFDRVREFNVSVPTKVIIDNITFIDEASSVDLSS